MRDAETERFILMAVILFSFSLQKIDHDTLHRRGLWLRSSAPSPWYECVLQGKAFQILSISLIVVDFGMQVLLSLNP